MAGFCRRCCFCFCEFCRSVPWGATAALVLCIFGGACVRSSKADMQTALDGAGSSGSVQVIAELIELPCLVILLLDVLALVLSSMASGRIRERIFRARSKRHGCCLRCFQCLAGPCAVRFVLCLVIVTYLIMIAASHAIVVPIIGGEIMNVICGLQDVMNQVQSVLDLMKKYNLGPKEAQDFKVDRFCSVAKGTSFGLRVLFLGYFVLGISQVFMTAVLSSNASRISSTRSEKKVKDEEPDDSKIEDSEKAEQDLEAAQCRIRELCEDLEEQQIKGARFNEELHALEKARAEQEEQRVTSAKLLAQVRAKYQFEVEQLQDLLEDLRSQRPSPNAEALITGPQHELEDSRGWQICGEHCTKTKMAGNQM
mmetsp:Transcript_2254/g.4384  ORF Transcript_2254/g.4384 Transcript_2254/m.4384 type:complete len:368 (+) Transcript_2254:673-1776(+)